MVFGCYVFYHEIELLVPKMEALPQDVYNGMAAEFEFERLAEDTSVVSSAALDALGVCEIAARPTDCSHVNASYPWLKDRTTVVQQNQIAGAFNRSLTRIYHCATDKYFGTPALQPLASELLDISNSWSLVRPRNGDCDFNTHYYCAIDVAAMKILEDVNVSMGEMRSFTKFDFLDTISSYSENLKNIKFGFIPIVIACLFFSCFLVQGSADRHTLVGGTTLTCAVLFWLATFVMSAMIVIAALSVIQFADSLKISYLHGEPSVAELLRHIETHFFDMYVAIFPNLFDGLNAAFNAAVVMQLVCAMQFWFVSCLMLCKPFKKNSEDEEHRPPEPSKGKPSRIRGSVFSADGSDAPDNRLGLSSFGEWNVWATARETMSALRNLGKPPENESATERKAGHRFGGSHKENHDVEKQQQAQAKILAAFTARRALA
jgi:hypothetical protein